MLSTAVALLAAGPPCDEARARADAPTSGEPAAAVYNRTARFFRGVAAELEWEELYFSQTDDGEQIDCAYKKRLRRRRHPPGHSRLE